MTQTVLPLCLLTAVLGAQPVVTTVAGRAIIPEGAVGLTTPVQVDQLAADPAGNVYFIHSGGGIYRLSNQGRIQAVFGAAYCQGLPFSGEGRAPLDTTICDPNTLAFDSEGSLYVATGNFFQAQDHRVLRVKNNVVTTVAGTGIKGFGADRVDALQSQVVTVDAVAVDSTGVIYLQQSFGGAVRQVANGQINRVLLAPVSSLATDHERNLYFTDGKKISRWSPLTLRTEVIAGADQAGFSPDGTPAESAKLNDVRVLASGPDGIYFLEMGNRRIRKIANGLLTTVAGTGQTAPAGNNVPALSASLDLSGAMAMDFQGSVYFTENKGLRIRKLSGGMITTIAGTDQQQFPIAALENEEPSTVSLPGTAVEVDTAGNVYASISGTILRVSQETGRLSTLAGVPGKSTYNGDKLPARQAQIELASLAKGPDGGLYFLGQGRVRRLLNGTITTVAGTGVGWTFAGCPDFKDRAQAVQANLCLPQDIALDGLGSIYIADPYFQAVLKVDGATGIFTAIASGVVASSVAVSPKGELFVGTGYGNLGDPGIFRVTDGKLIPVAGTGSTKAFADGSPALQASILPLRIAVDAQDNLYFTERAGTGIGVVSLTAGTIRRLLGDGLGGFSAGGYNGEVVSIKSARLWLPGKLAVDGAGNLYVADDGNQRIRKVQLATSPSLTIAGGNGQKLFQNQRTTIPLRVSANTAEGKPLVGVRVQFRVTSGSAVLSGSSQETNADGVAAVAVTATLATGRVAVEFSATGLPAVSFDLEVIPLPPPQIFAGGIAGAGLSNPPVRTLTPGGIGTVFGQYFRVLATSRTLSAADIAGGRLPDTMDGVCAVIGTKHTYIYALYPGQINFQVPDLAPGNYRFVIVTGCDTPSALFSNEVTVTIAAASPEFLYLFTAADGKKNIVAVKNSGSIVGPRGAVAGVPTEPASAGETLVMYAIGLGPTSPVVASGEIATAAASVTGAVRLTVGGKAVTPGYAGVTPGFAGLYQINFVVPDGLAAGSLPVSLSVGAASASGYLAVQ